MKTVGFILLLSVLVIASSAQPYSITATIPYNGSYASGKYQIYRSASNGNITLNNLRKPIVVVEGFDANNVYGIDYIKSMLYSGGNNSLGAYLNSLGHDIVILDFNQGGDYIQKNAFLLTELIRQINLQKSNKNDLLVVMGFSMGGLVARYALTYMEQHEAATGAHQARLFVSFDSPHKGAHFPVGIQALALTFSSNVYLTMFPYLADAINQFTAPAAKQMLKYRISSATQQINEIPVSTDHIAFMNELKDLNNCNGFPSKCRNIAFSLGSWNGVGQRSNLDLDNDGIKDLQHSGVPMLHINISRSSSGSVWLFQASTCRLASFFSFQSSASTAYSENYPYFSQRSSYSNLGNNVYTTYWYSNSNGPAGILFPQGAWSRLWWYKNDAPADFAPGSYTPAYSEVVTAINSQIKCSFGFAENCTFIPTVSALAFDTEDLFYNISADPDRLDKTPFDAIYGIDGDNSSHLEGQTSNSFIANSLIDEISNSYGFTCAKNHEMLSGIVNGGQNIAISSISTVEASNYTLKSGSNVNLEAGNVIILKPGFHAEPGSNFVAKISGCTSKACNWHPVTRMQSTSANRSISDINIIDEFSSTDSAFNKQTTTSMTSDIDLQEIQPENQIDFNIYPNPNKGYFTLTVDTKEIQSFWVEIISSSGMLVSKTMYQGTHQITVSHSLPQGIYFVRLSMGASVSVKKMLIN